MVTSVEFDSRQGVLGGCFGGLLKKENGEINIIFIRGIISEADIKDTDGDVLSKSDIKKMLLNLEDDCFFDINHDLNPVSGIKIIENFVSDTPLIINGAKVHQGSWIVTLEVDNEDIENAIRQGKINGFSLFSYADGKERYNDVENKERIKPLAISLVEFPANRRNFEIMDRESYISKMETKEMADEKSVIQKIKDIISASEASETIVKEEKVEEPTIAKEETPQAEDTQNIVKEAEEPIEEDEPVAEEPQEIPQEEEIEEDAVTMAEIKDLLLQIIEYVQAEPVEEAKEEPPADEEPAEEPEEEYIVKQATDKEASIEEPQIPKQEKFDLYGRKL